MSTCPNRKKAEEDFRFHKKRGKAKRALRVCSCLFSSLHPLPLKGFIEMLCFWSRRSLYWDFSWCFMRSFKKNSMQEKVLKTPKPSESTVQVIQTLMSGPQAILGPKPGNKGLMRNNEEGKRAPESGYYNWRAQPGPQKG